MNSQTAKLLNKWSKLHGKDKRVVRAIYNKTPKDKRGAALKVITMDINRKIIQLQAGRKLLNAGDVRQIKVSGGDVHLLPKTKGDRSSGSND